MATKKEPKKTTKLEEKIKESIKDEKQEQAAIFTNMCCLIEHNLRNNYVFASDDDKKDYEALKDYEASEATTKRVKDIAEAMSPYTA